MPLRALVSAHKPYQTVVLTAGLAEVTLVLIVAGATLLAGTPAKLDIGAVIFDWALVGPDPNPL